MRLIASLHVRQSDFSARLSLRTREMNGGILQAAKRALARDKELDFGEAKPLRGASSSHGM